ncbi:UMF1 family MFS transporter [Dyadobacter sp. BE34]|uniref:UMF1 family MFS transporter n=1 Tax=Dyadobacter fermentans TaxID=94254 RepID=A0ABU1R715_9BACT|nr:MULTISPECIES: MFS transporter [Dyadobacter]MBZ1357334.1 MFS transporter [Dyadobacter fermentans]MDR6809193.1 UMF1 family MFS transporter [Dyadobacter fermentans]MDR7046936.1 UMF1 family MFS transporter [Dyadobacter sp. BE242]MDR7201250.1 UMF1 family MFS transporter [Dyadobacter sp. BE34]MDR7219210.1 UMF1 family MFS transporter [Dyadobacter sp. BE31]
MKKNVPSIINAWCMYDWANSVHALVIVSSIFPVYFSATALSASGTPEVNFFGAQIKSSVLFSYTVSVSFLITALLIPICTAIADFTGKKKRFMQFFCYTGALSCMLLYFFTKETMLSGVFLFGLSLIGWSGSIVFYDSYLPEIATEDRFDQYSARGFSLGYLGSVLLLLFNLSMILAPQFYGITQKSLPARISFFTVGLWWILFAQIPFYYLPSGNADKEKSGNWIFHGFKELKKVYGRLREQPYLAKFLSAFFIYTMGLRTVMYVATIFGANELKLPSQSLIITVLLIQLVGIAGSYTFAWLSGKIGNIYALMIGVAIWIGICTGAYYTTEAMEFYVIACTVGMVMGGIQSLSRSTYSKLIPENITDTASYFSFYDVTEKLAIVIGTFIYGTVEHITGSMRNSILALLIIFVIGLLLLYRIPSRKVYSFELDRNKN